MNTPNYEDKREQQRIRHILNNDMGLCGCGSTNKYRIVKDMLERSENKGSFYEPLGDINADAVEFIAHVLNSKQWELLEHGSSVGSSWLTEKGEYLLHYLRHFGTDVEEWPEWWCSCGSDEEW